MCVFGRKMRDIPALPWASWCSTPPAGVPRPVGDGPTTAGSSTAASEARQDRMSSHFPNDTHGTLSSIYGRSGIFSQPAWRGRTTERTSNRRPQNESAPPSRPHSPRPTRPCRRLGLFRTNLRHAGPARTGPGPSEVQGGAGHGPGMVKVMIPCYCDKKHKNPSAAFGGNQNLLSPRR
jgi:hypothetical protein